MQHIYRPFRICRACAGFVASKFRRTWLERLGSSCTLAAAHSPSLLWAGDMICSTHRSRAQQNRIKISATGAYHIDVLKAGA